MRVAASTTLLLVCALHHAELTATLDDVLDDPVAYLKTPKMEKFFQVSAKINKDAIARLSYNEVHEKLQEIRDNYKSAFKDMEPKALRFIDLVMDRIESDAFSDTRRAGSIITENTREKGKLSPPKNYNAEEDESVQKKLVRSIAQKIETLTKDAFKKTKTNEEKQKIIDSIRKRVMESAKKHNVMIRSKNDDIKPYGELIVEGVEMFLHQTFNNDEDRRISLEFRGSSDDYDKINKSQSDISDNKYIADLELNIQGADLEETYTIVPLLKKQAFKQESNGSELDLCGCDCIITKTCDKISALNKFTCSHSKKVVLLEKLCDGIIDCPDKSDENHCTRNAIKKLRSTNRIIADIEAIMPRHCIRTDFGHEVLTSQNVVLNKVLQQQTDFLKKYGRVALGILDKDVVKHVGIIVSTVGFALDSAFCAHETEDVAEPSRRDGYYNIIVDEDLDFLIKKRSWAPPKCICDQQFCVKETENCSLSCERTCWQRYILGRWTCAAVTGNDSVSLDLICDGKIDCYDESDESGCTTGQTADEIEARDMYNFILKVLSTKAQLAEFKPAIDRFNSLQELIKQLLKHSTKARANAFTVKNLRDQCFSEIISIFGDILAKAELLQDVEDTHAFLLSLNEKLVSALKRSNTGNGKIVGTGECLCRGALCILPRCSLTCVRACTVKRILTKYSCEGKTNTTIPIESICNGKSDCPKGDDEEHCSKDVCRKHHLVLLRHDIMDLKKKHYDSTLFETLKSWQEKTIANLLVTEKTERSTQRVLQKTVAQSLHDLMMTYASLGEFRRIKVQPSVDEFVQIARLVQNILKSCTK